MDPNRRPQMPMMPPPPPRELTEEALAKEFTVKFTRRDILVIHNILGQNQYSLADARVIVAIDDKFKDPLNLVDNDYKKPETPSAGTPPPPAIVTGEPTKTSEALN